MNGGKGTGEGSGRQEIEPAKPRPRRIANEDVREFFRGLMMAVGWLIVSTILMVIAAFIVSAIF